MERCVDDSLLHDEDMETHWWRAIEFLELCGRSGIVLNPEKFQFSQMTVDFAGFRISNGTVEPLPKYLDAIRGFPTPRNITDIKSWFGMVAQVAHYARLRDMLEPFRKFLSPKVKFEWSQELDNIFEESKLRIVEAIRDGVQIYDITKRTCLRTDWSKSGIGYLLAQKHCDCTGRSYGCCQDGWRIALAGSRFLTPAEKNYAPVEGEALAVAWALGQTKFFTMGCNDLLVIVDHKPLVKILGDRRLDEIENPRLFRLKMKTLMWRYEIEYQRGSKNPFADAMSRYPNAYAELASIGMADRQDNSEELFLNSIGIDMEKVVAVTWEMVRTESTNDQTICLLKKLVLDGFPGEKSSLQGDTQDFWEVRHHLSVSDGVVLYKDRIVIPSSLRALVINNLHSAHQGVSSMLSRATTSLYWPRMTNDIHTARLTCRACNRNAPSHARLPPTAPELPTTPFEKIAADFFDLRGKHFLVIADRLSGWTEVVQVKVGSPSAGSKGLCDALRRIFVTFGVPNEISSDGGTEFTSGETQDFLSRWGTRHRLSSSHFPQSNGRAEVAVRVTKRLLEENMDVNGNLNNDRVARAFLQQRNTPDKDCNLSPAQVLLGRQLRDTLPQLDKSLMIFENDQIRTQWHQAWSAKEDAIRVRLMRTCENLESKSRELTPLKKGDRVLVQNQVKSSGRPNKWDRQGIIVASKNNDQYLVKVDGTGRLTLRNRRFLRRFSQPNAAQYGKPGGREPVAYTCETRSRTAQSASPTSLVNPSNHVPAYMSQPQHAVGDAVGDVVGDAVGDAMGDATGDVPENVRHSMIRDAVDDVIGDAVDQPGCISQANAHGPLNSDSDYALNDQDPGEVVQQQPGNLRTTRAPGRPRKQVNFNFAARRVPPATPPATPLPATPPPATPLPATPLPATPRKSLRSKTRAKVYDAATGMYGDPIS